MKGLFLGSSTVGSGAKGTLMVYLPVHLNDILNDFKKVLLVLDDLRRGYP